MKNTLWAEEYRPQEIKDCILPKRLKDIFSSYVEIQDVPQLILYGGPGVGKTTVAKALVNELGCDSLFINASNERNIDTLRDKVQGFATTVSVMNPGLLKIVILDEADYLNPNSFQPALRSFMEQYSSNCRFILTCNYLNKIIEPLHSRCVTVSFTMSKEERVKVLLDMYNRATEILREHRMSYDSRILGNLVGHHYPDWRRLMNELQRQRSVGDVLTFSGENVEISVDYLIEQIVQRNFTQAREFISQNDNVSTEHLFNEIYKQLEGSRRLNKECLPEIVICLNDHQYKDALVADKELNRASAVAELMRVCQWT